MELAWEDIKNHPQVTVTIDTYQWGFVFFRKEQEAYPYLQEMHFDCEIFCPGSS